MVLVFLRTEAGLEQSADLANIGMQPAALDTQSEGRELFSTKSSRVDSYCFVTCSEHIRDLSIPLEIIKLCTCLCD